MTTTIQRYAQQGHTVFEAGLVVRGRLPAGTAAIDTVSEVGLVCACDAVSVFTGAVEARQAALQFGQQYCSSCVGLLSFISDSSVNTLGPAVLRTASRS